MTKRLANPCTATVPRKLWIGILPRVHNSSCKGSNFNSSWIPASEEARRRVSYAPLAVRDRFLTGATGHVFTARLALRVNRAHAGFLASVRGCRIGTSAHEGAGDSARTAPVEPCRMIDMYLCSARGQPSMRIVTRPTARMRTTKPLDGTRCILLAGTTFRVRLTRPKSAAIRVGGGMEAMLTQMLSLTLPPMSTPMLSPMLTPKPPHRSFV